jgi:hypothetical protein
VVDVYLYPVPAFANPADVQLLFPSVLLNVRRRGRVALLEDDRKVIVAQSLYDALAERYGEEEGDTIYWKMRAEQKGPFAPEAKYAHDGLRARARPRRSPVVPYSPELHDFAEKAATAWFPDRDKRDKRDRPD